MGRKEPLMATTDPIRDLKQLHKLADYFLCRNKFRDYTMIVLGVYTILRISDLLKLQWNHVCDSNGRFFTHIQVFEQKTGKRKLIALNDKALEALRILYPHRRSAFIFASAYGDHNPITRVHAYRLIKTAANKLDMDGCISCHSLRKTLGYFLWKEKNVSPVVIMELYNHDNFETTKRYLGVAQDDLDEAYTGIQLF